MTSDSHRSFDDARHPVREEGRDLFLEGRFLSELEGLVEKPKAILVLGSGDGKESRVLARHFEGCRVVSMDLSAPEVEQASIDRDLREWLIRGDWDHPPFPDHTFDLVVLFAALHHSIDLPQTLHRIFHLLRPGGAVYATHEPMSSLLLGRSQKARMSEIAEEEGGIETSPSYNEYRQALEKAGFVSVSLNASTLNLIRLTGNHLGFEDVSVRRNRWPEKTCAGLLRLFKGRSDGFKLSLLFLVQRLAFGLFGVTIVGKKR